MTITWQRAIAKLAKRLEEQEHAQQAGAANETRQELIYAQRKAAIEEAQQKEGKEA